MSVPKSIDPKEQTKSELIIKGYLNERGESDLIERHSLPAGLAWTSGDGIFRSDGSLGKKYKFFRFAPLLNFSNQHSCCWELSPEDEMMIRREICKRNCANCGTTKDIQCDHKNDLKNDNRVVADLNTQTLDDFQALCRRCNIMKSRAKSVMMKTGKRYSALNLGYTIGFTVGDDTMDLSDINWHIGTYWGDCDAFKKKLHML